MIRISDFKGNVLVNDSNFDLGLKVAFSKYQINDFDKLEIDNNIFIVSMVKVTQNTFVKNDKNKLVPVNRIYILNGKHGEPLYIYKTTKGRVHQTTKLKVIYK